MILHASGTVRLCKIQNDDFQNPQGIEVLKKYMTWQTSFLDCT